VFCGLAEAMMPARRNSVALGGAGAARGYSGSRDGGARGGMGGGLARPLRGGGRTPCGGLSGEAGAGAPAGNRIGFLLAARRGSSYARAHARRSARWRFRDSQPVARARTRDVRRDLTIKGSEGMLRRFRYDQRSSKRFGRIGRTQFMLVFGFDMGRWRNWLC
jgi:hypothetical protein